MHSLIDVELFIDCIVIALYDRSYTAKSILTEYLNLVVQEYENTKGQGQLAEPKMLQFFIEIIKYILTKGADLNNLVEREALYLKLKTHSFLKSQPELNSSIEKIFHYTDDVDISAKWLDELLRKIHNRILQYHAYNTVKQMYHKLNICSSMIDIQQQQHILENIVELSKSLQNKYHQMLASKDEVLSKIDFSDKLSLKSALHTYKTVKDANVFKFGWQGLNRLFGKRGGMILGESVVFNALSHNYKSSMLMNIARWVIQYNIPKIDPHSGIPTVLFISLENEVTENMINLYKTAYISITNQDPNHLSEEEIIDFIYEHFNMNGWKLIIERRLGQNFGYEELVSVFEMYESAGHKILVCIIDYMNMMKKSNDTTLGNHLKLRELYTNIVNYLKHKNCCMVTAHQLNRKAAEIVASGATNIVDKLNTAHLADAMDPQREVDVAIYMHIEKNQYGIPYLTMRIDKHRYVNDTPESWKKTAYRFSPLGIPDDIGGEDMSIKDIYADRYEVPNVQVKKSKKKDKSTSEPVPTLETTSGCVII